MDGITRFISGISDISYKEFTKDHKSCIEQDNIKVKDRLVANIDVVIDLNASDTESKNLVTFLLESYTGTSVTF